jgi:hypothetical protein
MTCAPRRLAPPVWRWAHRMLAGLKKLTWWLTALALALGNRGQVKRRVHARTHARTCAPRPPSPPPPPPPPSLPPPPKSNISTTAFSSDNRLFYLCSLHFGIRQGALLKFQGDLEAVASPWGSSQLGGYPAISPLFRFLFHMDSLILDQSSMFFVVLSRMSCTPVEASRCIPCFCLSSCATLSGVGTYSTHGAISLGKVRALAVVRRVASGVSMISALLGP